MLFPESRREHFSDEDVFVYLLRTYILPSIETWQKHTQNNRRRLSALTETSDQELKVSETEAKQADDNVQVVVSLSGVNSKCTL